MVFAAQNPCKELTFPGCLLLQEASMEQAFWMVPAIDSWAVTQPGNHSGLHKRVPVREPRASCSGACGRDVSHKPSAGLHWGCSRLRGRWGVCVFEGV